MSSFTELIQEYTEEAQELDEEIREGKRLRPMEGYPFWPHEVLRDAVIVLIFLAGIFYVSSFLPYYLEAPADPAGQPQIILPDWYLLWTYGMLQIAADITIGAGLSEVSIAGFSPFPIEIMTAKLWGIMMQGVVVGIVAVIPFLDRGPKAQRPVEQPFWASAGFAALIYIFTISVYSINGLISSEWPVYGQEYMTWTQDYISIFQLDLLAWLTHLVPILAFFVTYIPLWHYKKEHGYEAKLSSNYYRVR